MALISLTYTKNPYGGTSTSEAQSSGRRTMVNTPEIIKKNLRNIVDWSEIVPDIMEVIGITLTPWFEIWMLTWV